ncbi:TIGR00266 family protein [Psychrobacter sp. I-STPA6b]|uniref:TIGR00266 family protein n=1 Tax=Psychrobacter sp. I-STPA6b TaxID=2585718 RepID=UPI001D0C0CD1|nr:TIGR00266 family protein [Psychrobacter sp. I-STPA6b]
MAATFSLIGTIEPFLHCNLKKGDRIYCEANAMVMMESNLELKGKLQGGIMQALMRRFANDESLFQQEIEAVHGEGDCLLAPTLDGDMQIIDIGEKHYTLNDGAFVAATHNVDVRANIQRNLGGAVFGDTGGFVVMQTSGSGQLVVSGFGSLFEIEVTPRKDVIIDNGHVVCWDSRLDYKLSVSTSKKNGFMSNIINSVTSGEGMVLNFSGSGKVIICSRNRDSYQGWIQSILGSNSGGRGGNGGFLDQIM